MTQNTDDRLAAIEQRLTDLEATNAALTARVVDLEAVNALPLGELRAARAAADPEAQAMRAVEQQRDKERSDALSYLKLGENRMRFPLHALRPVVDAGRVGKIIMPADGEELRRALPRLEQDIERLRALVQRAPWPEGEQRLQKAEALLADARAVLAAFDRLVAEREAARRPRRAAS